MFLNTVLHIAVHHLRHCHSATPHSTPSVSAANAYVQLYACHSLVDILSASPSLLCTRLHASAMASELHDSFLHSLLEQVERMGHALELANLEQARLDSLYFTEIVKHCGLSVARQVSNAVHSHTASASSSHNTTRRLATFPNRNPTIVTPPSETYHIPKNNPTNPPPSETQQIPRNNNPFIAPPSETYQTLQNRPTATPAAADPPPVDTFNCPICLESKPTHSSVTPCTCDAKYCLDCMRQMLEVVTNEKGAVPVRCPTCPQTLDTDTCLRVLEGTPHYASFSALVTEKLHHANLRYCANARCGAPFDWSPPVSGSVADATRAHCPLCGTDTCVECRVPWHAGQTCAEYRANEADINAVGQLAARMRWMPCPKCHALIEKQRGDCNFVRCTCRCAFCFNCGVPYLDTDSAAGNGHGRPGCSCGLFEDNRRRGADAPPQIVVRAIRDANRAAHGDGPREVRGKRRKRRVAVKPNLNPELMGGELEVRAERRRHGRREVPRDRAIGRWHVGNRRGDRVRRGHAAQPRGHAAERHRGRMVLSDDSSYSSDSSSTSDQYSLGTNSGSDAFMIDTSDDDSTRTWLPRRQLNARARRGIVH